MSSPADIICFAKDWAEPATSNNHVMEELARQGHRVLWVNPLAMRAPSLGSAHDRKKILRKVKGWFRGVQQVSNNLRVLSPVLIPLPRSRFVQTLNSVLVTAQVRRAMRHWGFDHPQLWIFPPNAVDFVGRFGESALIYYCTDEWSQFGYLNAELMQQKEAVLLRKADVVFVSSQKLLETKHPHNTHVHLMSHGVNHALFARALSDDLPFPADLLRLRSAIPHPFAAGDSGVSSDSASLLNPHPSAIIGFYGNIYNWVDQELIAAMAQARPSWSFVLVGKIMTDVSILRKHANVHFTGMRPYTALPSYCKGFDVGLIPYRLNDPRMATVNPLKLREYLAAGVPVVSVDLPEVRILADEVTIASGVDDFLQKIEGLLASETPAQRQKRSDRMRSESWEARVQRMEQIITTGSS